MAREHLGCGRAWPKLAAANPQLTNVNQLQIGTKLRIPHGRSVSGRVALHLLHDLYLGGMTRGRSNLPIAGQQRRVQHFSQRHIGRVVSRQRWFQAIRDRHEAQGK